MKESSQKEIERNRAPRVHINYELGSAKKKIELPFIVGVIAPLAGKSESDEARKSLDKREFQSFDIDNFSTRMAALQPTVKFDVPDLISGDTTQMIPVTLKFNRMSDFSPEVVASRVPGLKDLMATRNQLAALLLYMDGKPLAQDVLKKVIQDKALMETIAALPKPVVQTDLPDPTTESANQEISP